MKSKSLLKENKYTEASELLNYIINTYPSSRFAIKSLLAINVINKENKLNNAKTYLEGIKQSKRNVKELEKTASELLVYELIESGSYKEAVKESEEIVKKYSNTETEKNALLNLVFISTRLTGDMQAAAEYYAELKSNYPQDEQTLIAAGEMGSDMKNIYSNKQFKQSVSSTQGILLSEYTLEQNYPNPFNPTTRISYSLPEANFVTLKIYDILGSEVAVLVNENKTAGKYEVAFDASRFSSGIYVYKLVAGSYQITKKMQLVK